ncbi:MAG: hypothetical protein HYZ27_00785, partial [Deltaproteobacteria bacterium]|nr:hypothetical protein [Deltaproteobacteria bacterium]
MATDLQPHLQTLAHSPGDATALAAVEAAYRAEGRIEELLRVVEDNAQRVEPNAAAMLWRKAAGICLNELKSAPRAEAYLQRALDSAPSDAEALGMLRQILIERGDLERGAEVWEKELARTTDARTKAKGLIAVADIYGTKLRRDDKALSTLRAAQRIQPKDPAIYRGLAAIYEAQGRLDQAQAALLSELENGGPTDDLMSRLGQLAERLLHRPKLHELARAAVEAVLRVRSHDNRAQALKRELDTYKSAWSLKVTDLVQRAVEAARTDPNQAAEAWLTLAEIQLVYGEQPEAALGSLDKAVAARPGHPGALRLMEEIYGGQERFDELALKLEMMAGYAREPAVAVDIYLKAALLYAVRLDNPDAAAKIHLRVLALDPGNKVSSNALAEHYRERKEWNKALEVLRAWADKATQAADKVAAHYACCRIYEEELGDRNAARPHYEAILTLDPENQAAARALEDVYRAAGAHAQLARVLKAKLAGQRGNDRVAVLSELGQLLAGPANEPAGALKALGELYQLKPEAKLRERLEELAAMAGAFADLVQILEGGLDRIKDNADRVQALHSIAALYEGARDAPLEALRIHRRILALAPADARAKESVERLMQSAAQTGDKIAFYREQAEAAGSDSERAGILHKLATELVDTVKDYVRATDVYRQILKVAPRDAAAVEGLLALYRRDNRWAEVAEVLRIKTEGLSGAARLPVALELARIMEQRLAQVDAAVDWFRDALTVSPGHTEARAGLERLLSRAREVVPIAEVLQPYYLKD